VRHHVRARDLRAALAARQEHRAARLGVLRLELARELLAAAARAEDWLLAAHAHVLGDARAREPHPAVQVGAQLRLLHALDLRVVR
jgi:hypothetical protein